MSAERFRSLNPDDLPRHFDAEAAEERWNAHWQETGIHHYDASRPRDETFVVDTPPPTASGSLHLGHIFSYTHTDILVRHQRMRGRNIYYPMGWDDNGLPTERRVQNYYHVRCNPELHYEKGLTLEPATAKQRKDRPQEVSRANFIELCDFVTQEDEKTFKTLWTRLGLSVDWRQEYATIDEHCRRIAQLSFLDLFEKGHAYTAHAPTLWDVDFRCAIAQAEVEDREKPGAFHDIEFGVEGEPGQEGGTRGFVISTTRPELLPACVAVTAHPEDERYRALFGKRAVTPLFHAPVPIFASDKVDPEKGTGILMVCTFGDATDVQWWRDEGLPLRQLVGRDGRMQPVRFGGDGSGEGDGFESLRPEDANRHYAELAGKNLAGARRAIVELLQQPEGSATGGGAPLKGEPRTIQHSVKFYEKGDRPLEFLPTRQWFVRLLDRKAALLEKGREIQWHPAHMQKRYEDWTEGLAFDWGISRQRYFGVPIPAWYPLDADGRVDYEQPIVAEASQLPLDPVDAAPPGFEESQRNQPGGFTADPDVFDTWFTSSMTPQIASHWKLDPARHGTLFPSDLRPQGQDIIRTWAFYTIAKALLHEDTVPWKHVAVSGWILDPDRKKMSKSKGNVITPMPLLEQYTADGVRYWAGSARLGVDTAIDEKVFKVGKRLVTKLFNASKFVLAQTGEVHPITAELDRAFVGELRQLVEQATRSFEAFDHAHALMETETFFWTRLTDTYLELVKTRARSESDAAGRGSAVAALRLGLDVLLRLFAPFLPYITEEIWSWGLAEETGHQSVHRAPWPAVEEFAGVEPAAGEASFATAVAALAAINKAKADAEVGMGRDVLALTLRANPRSLAQLEPVLVDVLAAGRCQSHTLEPDESLEDARFEAPTPTFAEKQEKSKQGDVP